MWKLGIGAAGAAVALTCSGCTTYTPPSGSPIAMIYTQAEPGVMNGGASLKRANADFSQITYLRGQDVWYLYGIESTIEAGSRQYLEVNGMRSTTEGTKSIASYCSNYFSFVPIQGHSYVVTQYYLDEHCRATVIDRTTTVAPPTYVIEAGPR